MVRAISGANGFWGFLLTGSGVHGDYWLLVLQALFGISVLYLGLRGARQPFHWLLLLWHEWTLANRIFLLIALLLLPIQFVLLNSGEPHGPGDQAGVVLTMLQWWFIYFALFPWPKRTMLLEAGAK